MSKKINIELDNKKDLINQDKHFSLLIAMERSNFPVKYGCLMGVCGACELKVVEGKDNLEYFEEPMFDTSGDIAYPCCCKANGDVKFTET